MTDAEDVQFRSNQTDESQAVYVVHKQSILVTRATYKKCSRTYRRSIDTSATMYSITTAVVPTAVAKKL